MSVSLKHLRSDDADRRPLEGGLKDGQIALNVASGTPGLFFKDNAGNVVKVGPAHVGSGAPNTTSTTSGNSIGELWYDLSALNIWDGNSWQVITSSGSSANDGILTIISSGIGIAGSGVFTANQSGNTTVTFISNATSLNTSSTIVARDASGGFNAGTITVEAQGDVRFADSDSSNWVAFQAPSTIASDVTWTLPSGDGTIGQVLSTNGSGTLSWATPSGGASVTTSDTAPSSPSDGDLWYDSVGGRTYVYYDDGTTAQWVDASPQGGTIPSLISYGNTSAEVIDTGSDGRFVVTTEGSERLRVDSSGRVGIGTSSPQNLLHLRSDVSGAATQLYLMNRTSGASVESRIAFTTSANDLSDNRHAYIGAVTTGAGENGNNFVIATNPVGGSAQTRVFVSSTGNVGIGTTSPAQNLDIAGTQGLHLRGTTYTNFSDYWGSGDNRAMFLPYGFLGSNGSFALSLYANGYRNASSGFTYMGINGNTSTAAGFDLYPDGNIVFRNGTASGTSLPERARIDSSGYLRLSTSSPGIQFNGNTAAANALDDYEEGTWTPVVADASTGGNTATGTFNGAYTKVGNLVTITVSLVNIVTTGMTGTNILFIRSLPFTAASLTGTNLFTGAVATANTTSTPFCVSILDNTSYIRLVLNQSTNQAIYYNTVSEFTSGSADIYCTITYQAA